jgi:hypothetical protein
MFVHDYIDLERPFATVGPRFISGTAWLTPLAEDAAAVTREVTVRLAGGPAGSGVRTSADDGAPVRCHTGSVRAHGTGIVVPLAIAVRDAGTGVPDLTGELEVVSVGSDRTQITLNATYRRPEHGSERTERAVAAGVRDLLHGIARVLVASVPEPRAGPGPARPVVGS